MFERLGIRARLIFASILLTLVAGLAIDRFTSAEIESSMTGHLRSDLVARLRLVEDAIVGAGRGSDVDWSGVARRLGAETGARLTLISPAGQVVGDSEAAASGSEDVAAQPEIRAAREQGEGLSIRESPTRHVRTLYV